MQTTPTATHAYSIDPAHSTIRFWVRHMMIAKVHGEMGQIEGKIELDPADPERAKVDVSIPAASLNTGNDGRDTHLKSADFLDVDAFPTLHFVSNAIRRTGDETFDVSGDLTIHGVTRAVTLKAEVTPEVASHFGGYRIGVSATTQINREDFGMTWNQALETGGVLVAKEINIQIDLELDRPA